MIMIMNIKSKSIKDCRQKKWLVKIERLNCGKIRLASQSEWFLDL